MAQTHAFEVQCDLQKSTDPDSMCELEQLPDGRWSLTINTPAEYRPGFNSGVVIVEAFKGELLWLAQMIRETCAPPSRSPRKRRTKRAASPVA